MELYAGEFDVEMVSPESRGPRASAATGDVLLGVDVR